MAASPYHNPTVELLRPFWTEAGVPEDRFLYYEFQARRYGSIVDFLARYGPRNDRRTLDLGAGVGSLSVVLKARLGGEYDLAERVAPSGPHADALRRRGIDRLFACDLARRTPLEGVPEGYDTVLLVEVLEHLLVNPLLLFRNIWEHLAPGGLLFVTTPNMARLRNRAALLAGRSIKERGRYPWNGSDFYGHVIEFTLDELDQLLSAESFRRDQTRVVQQVPRVYPTTVQRAGVRVLNTGLAQRLRLGDDLLVAYRKIDRPADGRCPVPLDSAGRI
ncbi:MAG: class I SAM-dependent methyltransferase [Thermoplasmata archaeon]|nr:class I SAM-dependent methyltransferase [Thermoplasmata archaeon]MCI4354615.1 class I SAM-dependent methyltransferase [Thermoplasmata archaeon]